MNKHINLEEKVFRLARSIAVKTIYPREKGSTYELCSSSWQTAVVSLFKKCNFCAFFDYFSGLGVLPHP